MGDVIRAKVLKGEAVYWPPSHEDNTGRDSFGDPIQIKCRWEEKAEQYMTPGGSTQVSKAVVMVDRDLELDGVLWEGNLGDVTDLDNPFALDKAWKIQALSRIPNRRQTKYLRQVYL